MTVGFYNCLRPTMKTSRLQTYLRPQTTSPQLLSTQTVMVGHSFANRDSTRRNTSSRVSTHMTLAMMTLNGPRKSCWKWKSPGFARFKHFKHFNHSYSAKSMAYMLLVRLLSLQRMVVKLRDRPSYTPTESRKSYAVMFVSSSSN